MNPAAMAVEAEATTVEEAATEVEATAEVEAASTTAAAVSLEAMATSLAAVVEEAGRRQPGVPRRSLQDDTPPLAPLSR